VIWQHDVRDDQSRSRQVAKLQTPDALAELVGCDDAGALSLPEAFSISS